MALSLLWGLVGLISGWVSSYMNISPLTSGGLGEALAPGYVFGISLSLLFLFSQGVSSSSFVKLGLLIAASTGAYYAAYWVSASSFEELAVYAFLPGGLVGAFVLVLGLRLLVFRFGVKAFVVLVLLGGLLGFLGPTPLAALLPRDSSSQEPIAVGTLNFPRLFMLWQAGMALGIGSVYLRQRSRPLGVIAGA